MYAYLATRMPVIIQVALGLLFIARSTVESANSTPRQFEELFIHRCQFYQDVVNAAPFKGGKGKNCTSLWQKFSKAWIGVNPCKVDQKGYAEFAEEAYHDFHSDKESLWQGSQAFVANYAKDGARIFHIALTLSGYLADPFVWCGSTTSSNGIDYSECPSGPQCKDSAVMSFWREVSEKYAANLNGTITIYLNGSGTLPAYGGILANHEIPKVNPSRVRRIDIIVTHTIGKVVKETCSKGPSIDVLKNQLKGKKIQYTCRDDPPPVLHYLCIDHPGDSKCRFASYISGSRALSATKYVLVVVTLLQIILNTCTVVPA